MSASSTCECWPNEQTAYSLHPHRTRSAAASLLVAYREIPEDGCTAKQRGRRLPLSASSSCECRPNRHTVCIRLARYRSRTLTGRVRSLGTAPLQSKEEGGSLCRQAAPASAGQTGKQFAFAWHGNAAASVLKVTDSWLGTAPMQSKEEGGAPLSASSSCECQPDRQTVCTRLAPQSSRTLARWLVGDIPDDDSTAKQRGMRPPLSASSSWASSSCECRPGRQTVCIRLAWQRSRKLARWLVDDP